MRILSESIADYIDLNYDIEEFNDISELDKVEELVVNNYNYSLDIVLFYPYELSYFKNLKECTFMNFEIADEVVDNLNKICLKKLSLDNCSCIINNKLNVEKLFVELCNINLNKIYVHDLTMLECGTIDICDLNNDLDKLTLLNCDIVNSSLLKNFKDCKIELIGCTLDDDLILSLENVKYDSNRYEKIV